MGMPITIAAVATTQDVEAAYVEFVRIDEAYSPYKDTSLVCQLQRGEITPENAPSELQMIIQACETWKTRTNGYFDAYYSGIFDPSGYVKGWAISRAADIFRKRAIPRFSIDAGGDIEVRGRWTVGIKHPQQHDKIVKPIVLADCAIATSGLYERGEHIINPHDRKSSTSLQSVSVVAPSIITADVLATTFFAMGDAITKMVDMLPEGCALYVISADNQAYFTPNFQLLIVD